MVHGVNKLPSRPTSALNNRNEGSKNWKAMTAWKDKHQDGYSFYCDPEFNGQSLFRVSLDSLGCIHVGECRMSLERKSHVCK
jgi:hypothetical protein